MHIDRQGLTTRGQRSSGQDRVEPGGRPEWIAERAGNVGPTLGEVGLGEQLATAVHRAEPDLYVIGASPALGGLVDKPPADQELTGRYGGAGGRGVDEAVVRIVEDRPGPAGPGGRRVGG